MTSSMAQGLVSEAPSLTKDDVVDWIVKGPCTPWLTTRIEMSENTLVHCAKELPAFTIPYGKDDSNKDIVNRNSDATSDSDDENEDQ